MIELKKALKEQCLQDLRSRKSIAEEAMKGAQDSANQETKSSAGDKYETGRAMAQQERDKFAAQVAQLNKSIKVLEQMPIINNQVAEYGALVKTGAGFYFLATSLGSLTQDNAKYFAVSPTSPIGQALLGLKKGEATTFNGQNLKVEEVF